MKRVEERPGSESSFAYGAAASVRLTKMLRPSIVDLKAGKTKFTGLADGACKCDRNRW
jgi:hypothetical protein